MQKNPVRTPALSANIDIMQSSILTDARFGLKRIEMQIVLIIMAAAQQDLREIINNGMVVPEYREDILVKFSLNDYPIDMDRNERLLIAAAKNLVSKTVETLTPDGWRVQPFVSQVDYVKKDRSILLTIRPSIWRQILDVRLGYSEYELLTAMKLKSIYSVRFYIMASSSQAAREYSIQELKQQFRLENKYTQPSDFLKNVVRPAIEELNEKASVTFEMALKKRPYSKEIEGIILTPKKNRPMRDPELEEKKLTHGRVQTYMILSEEENDWLKNTMRFSPTELNSNFATFNLAKKVYGVGLINAMKAIYSYMSDNGKIGQKGYFIKSLKQNITGEEKPHRVTQGSLFD